MENRIIVGVTRGGKKGLERNIPTLATDEWVMICTYVHVGTVRM